MKKFVSILLVVVLTMTSLSAGLVGFAETYTPDKSAGRIFLSVTSEKDKYAWGDELVFIVSANNNTESDYKNVKIRAQANKAKFFYDGESNTETIDYIKAGETKEIQIKVKASSPNVFQRMFILPIYYIIDFLSPMAFNANNYDTTMLVKVGAFRYKFGFDVTDGEKNELDVQNNEALEDYERILQMLDKDDNGCADCIENNDYITDTDGDELPDYYELVNCYTNPLLVDTDGDGVDDAYADLDRDGLSNHQELINSTNPTNMDTDKDGLNDGEELFRIHTAPLKVDTDGDGAYDGTEVEIGTNPLIAESTFDVKKTAGNEDGVRATVEVALSGEQVESLNVEPVNNKVLFPETIPGYLGAAYDFSVNGTFSEAKISFEFNEEKNIGNDFDPIIYYFNEAEQRLEALETTIAGNVASAVVKHFSTYILINRAVYESAFDWIDVWSSDENYSAVELVLIIDDSGSMSWNDSDNQRLTVAKNLIDKLPENSKIGIVKFESGVSALTSSLIVEKDSAKAYLTTSYFRSSGGTRMYTGIQSGLSLFGANEDTTLKIAVVLSDGETDDTSMHSSIINTAKEKKVKVYTVGLGNSTSYFNNYLKPLASSTGGAFYLADNASQLSVIYEDI